MDSDDEFEATPSWKGIPASIICINTYDQNSETFEVAYAATCRMIRECLRLSTSHFIGVCLYGTEVSNSSILGINSVEEVFPLKLPTLEDYKKMHSVARTTLNKTQGLIMSEVLWYCSRAFASCKRQLSARNIIILSRLDVPPLLSDEMPTFNRVMDLSDSNIDIELINISKTEYKIHNFYEKFLTNANKKDEIYNMLQPLWDMNEIQKLMYQQLHRHLAVAALSFDIGNNLEIGVGVYTLMRSNWQPKRTDLNKDDNAILTSVNKTMKVTVREDNEMDVDEEQTEPKAVPLLKSELLHYKIFGGEKVQFTDDEMKTLRNPFGPPMLKLLGFKPANILCKEKWFLKPCYFLFPKEEVIEGSFVAFKALYEACIKTKVVAICILCTRVNARPFVVALSPSSKPLGLDIDIGFDIIRVPFVENVRHLPPVHEDCDNEEVHTSEANKSVLKDILKGLEFDFKSDMFENPKLQTQYRAIESIALDEDDQKPFIDTTKPNCKRFQNLQDDLFHELFGPFGPVPVKKPASSRECGPASKKVKQEGKQEIDEALLQTRLNNQRIKDYTVVDLKGILYSRDLTGLPALNGLKKNELVELVYKYCK